MVESLTEPPDRPAYLVPAIKADQMAREGEKDEISPAMIEAGTARLADLLAAGTSSTYVVCEVY